MSRRHAIRRINAALRILAAHADHEIDTDFIEAAADMFQYRIEWVRERDGFDPRTSRVARPEAHDAH